MSTSERFEVDVAIILSVLLTLDPALRRSITPQHIDPGEPGHLYREPHPLDPMGLR